MRLAPPNPTDNALFFVPHRNLPAFAGNAEVGSNEGQDGKPILAMTCSASGLLGLFLIPLEQTQDWRVTRCYRIGAGIVIANDPSWDDGLLGK